MEIKLMTYVNLKNSFCEHPLRELPAETAFRRSATQVAVLSSHNKPIYGNHPKVRRNAVKFSF